MAWKSMHGGWEAAEGKVDDLLLKLLIVAIWPGIPVAALLWGLSR
jgi:hypothetical protein